jgi:hypothetical protein
MWDHDHGFDHKPWTKSTGTLPRSYGRRSERPVGSYRIIFATAARAFTAEPPATFPEGSTVDGLWPHADVAATSNTVAIQNLETAIFVTFKCGEVNQVIDNSTQLSLACQAALENGSAPGRSDHRLTTTSLVLSSSTVVVNQAIATDGSQEKGGGLYLAQNSINTLQQDNIVNNQVNTSG